MFLYFISSRFFSSNDILRWYYNHFAIVETEAEKLKILLKDTFEVAERSEHGQAGSSICDPLTTLKSPAIIRNRKLASFL